MNVARLAVALATTLLALAALPSAPLRAAPPTAAKHLQEGRKLTKAGDYPAAIAALDRALALSPGDATALAARGYARLLSVPEAGARDAADRAALAAARQDFDAALAATTDAKLQGRIRHNLGLLTKRLGPSGCAATVTRATVGALHPTWKAAAAAWASLSPEVMDGAPQDDAEARAALCREGCAHPRANGVVLGGFDGVQVGALVEVPGKGIWSAVVLDGWREYQCQPEGAITLKPLGSLWHIEASVKDPQVVGTDQDGNDCDPEDLTEGCQRGCFHQDVARTASLVVDPATARAVRVEGPPGLPVTVEGRTVKVGTCAPVSLDGPAGGAP